MRCFSALFVAVAVMSAGCNAFTGAPLQGPRSTSSMTMRLGGGSRGGFSIRKWFTSPPGGKISRPGKGGSSNGGGIIGGGGGAGIGGGGSGSNWGGMTGADGEGEGGDMDAILALASMGILGDLWKAYNDVLEEKPILTKACTSLCGFSIGDILAQKFVSPGDAFDYKRLARMAAFGFVIHGTVSHFFYNKLEEVIPAKDAVGIISKVATDQILWAPIFTIIFFTFNGILEGKTPADINAKVKQDLWPGVRGSWTVWPLAHAISFRFVPLKQRLLYINTIQIGYNIFLSLLSSKGVSK